MRQARADAVVDLPPDEALAIWTDVERWRSFVDGFARAEQVTPDWPEPGAEVVWRSTPEGRGRVTERVESYEAPPPAPDVAPESEPGRLVTRVADDSLEGTQTATFALGPEGTHLELELEYELRGGGGRLRGVTDLLFIRRALRDSLRRTVEAFVAEAAPEASDR